MTSPQVERGRDMSFDKYREAHVEDAETSPTKVALVSEEEDTEFTPEEQRKIMHRVDRRLIIICGLMYCVSLKDRSMVSGAAVAGMTEDLVLIDYRYSTIVLVFFATYVVFQAPMTVVCRKVGPRPFLTLITFSWSVLMIGGGFVKKWEELAVIRLLLGVMEAGFFPGAVYLISTWYPRYQLQKRYAVFYFIGSVASAVSGLLSIAILQMKGIAGLGAWRWMFLILGFLTFVIAVLGGIFLIDFPDQAHKKTWRFLNERECQFVLRRIARDRDDAVVEPFNIKKWAASGLDLKVWGFGLIFFCLTTCTYSIAYFLPLILQNSMGFSTAAALGLTAPPYVAAGIVMFASSWWADKYRVRSPVLVVNACITLIGLPIMGFHAKPAVRLVGVFLTTIGANANIPAAMTYQANNIRGQWKRAFCSALFVGMGGVGGIAGSLVFRSQDAPDYRPGIYATMACNGLILILVAIMSTYFKISNRRADQGKLVIEGLAEFRYTL